MQFVLVAMFLGLAWAHDAGAKESYSCNMSTMTQEELAHYHELASGLKASVQEIKELKNGFAFKLPADAVVPVSQWIAYERKCCPFFDFALEIPKDSGPVWLRITGERGIKDFIRTEFELGETK